jgi:hypothetical protein
VLVVARAGATVTRYVALRSWVFAHRGSPSVIDRPALQRAGR